MKMMIHPVEAAQEAEAVQVAAPAEAVRVEAPAEAMQVAVPAEAVRVAVPAEAVRVEALAVIRPVAEAVQFSMHRHIQRNVRRAVILPVPARAKAAGQKELRMTAPTTVRMTEQRDRQRKPETKVHR